MGHNKLSAPAFTPMLSRPANQNSLGQLNVFTQQMLFRNQNDFRNKAPYVTWQEGEECIVLLILVATEGNP